MHQLLTRSTRHIGVALTCLVILLSLSTAAVTAQDQLEDPILNAAREAGLITEIGQTQKRDDVTVTLDWAYADTQRIVLSYTLEPSSTINDTDWSMAMVSSQLVDDKSASFSYVGGYYKKAKQPNQLVVVTEYYPQAIIPVEGSQDFTVNNDYFNPAPDKINLTFDPKLTPTGAQSALPFAFHFTVPLYKPVVVKEAQSITIKGVHMTLEQVSVTPTRTIARICYNMPDSRDWTLESTVELNGMTSGIAGAALVGGKEAASDTKNRCRDLSYNVYYDKQPTSINVTVDHIATSMGEGPDDWNKIKPELAKHNIQIEVISVPHALDVKILNVPEGVDYDQAVLDARESLGDLVKGPWKFTVDLP